MSETILVVDDDERVLQTLSRYLRRGAHTVLTAGGGAEALQLYVQERPDIVFSDVRMPPPDGFALLQSIRERDSDIEVILITGHSDMEMAIEALRMGASDFIPKPVEPGILEGALRRAQGRLSLKRELREARAALEQYAAELEQRVAQRTRELTAANERLEELDRIKTKFIADISHELRTPLTSVHLLLRLLERGKAEKRSHYLASLKEETGRLTRIIQDILEFSQLELSRDKVKLAPLDLNELVSQALAEYRPRIEAANLALTLELEPTRPLVLANPGQLKRALTKLLDNAVNYTPAGELRVSTRVVVESKRVDLQVGDTGRGVDPADMPHLFERFYRGQGVGSSALPGAGLGLAVVKEIAELHGGEIGVESEVGVGSTFRVRLPLADLPAD